MSLHKRFDTIILEGGSLKCAFTAGILDVFLDNDYVDFQNFYGVSSGSMAMSYFISRQRKHFIKVTRALVENPDFLSYINSFSSSGLMNLDFLEEYVRETFPFDYETALNNIEGRRVKIIATDKISGKPHYITPTKENWINVLMASATLPFITKGETSVEGVKLFDGGYSDPIPIREAIKNGSKNILIIRTRPSDVRLDQSYVSWFAEYWNYDNDSISNLFHNSFKTYNDRAEFLSGERPDGVYWHMLAPSEPLKSDGYYLYKEDVDSDYRLGLEVGMDFLEKIKKA